MALPEAVTREELYMKYLTGDTSIDLPLPITRKEIYLYYLCQNGTGGGTVTPEQIEAAVNKYLTENPVQAGATEEQAQQIEKNKNDIIQINEKNNNPSIYEMDLIQQTLGVENLWDQGRIEKEYNGSSTWQAASKEIEIEPGEYTVYVGINGLEGAAYNYVTFGYNAQGGLSGGDYKQFKMLQKILVDGENPKFEGKLVVKFQISDNVTLPPAKKYYIDNILVFKGDITSKPGIPVSFVSGYKEIEDKIKNLDGKKLDKKTGKNQFDKNSRNIIKGKYLSQDGRELENADYFISDYMPVEIGNHSFNYREWGIGGAYCCAYNENREFISSFNSTPVNITEPGFVRMSGRITNIDMCQFEKGETSTDYEPYTDFLPSQENKQEIEKIKQRLAQTDLFVEDTRETMNENEIITFENIPNCKQNNVISFYANIENFDKVGMSHGKIEYRCGFIEVDSQNLYVYSSESTIKDTFAHGLSISDYISVIVDVGYKNTADVTITSIGGLFKKNITWVGCKDNILFESHNSKFNNVKATFLLNDLNKKLWCFGDSYFDFWAVKMYELGFGNFYADAFSGRNSAQALESLKNCMKYKIPNKIYWCLGMNDPDNGKVNENWLAVVEELKTTCAEKEIKLIFSTIPSTPINDNSYKNQYIYDSGYKYVDINRMVGASENTSWYEGLLGEDNIHPSTNGTNVIIATNISSFPEMKND